MVQEADFYEQPTLVEGQAPARRGAEPCESKTELPEKVGPYHVEALLKKGGMSLVYLGTRQGHIHPFAIKVLPKNLAENPLHLEAFKREAEVIALADHPNIVHFYGHGQWEGGFYIAMEFIQGISLRQFLTKHPLPLKRAMELILEIVGAIAHLHTHQIIHRDIKPENILVTEEGRIKLIDFGIVQVAGNQLHSLNPALPKAARTPRIEGTPIYMSPEQRDDPGSVSYASDVYSLGVVIYELVLGRLCQGVIHISLLPKGLQDIVSRALQPEPQDRYADIVDLMMDLQMYFRSAEVEKDGKTFHSYANKLAQHLQQTGQALLPSGSPDWQHVDIGVLHHSSFRVTGIYFDFFKLANNSYGVFMGEAASRGAKGLISSAQLRGMVRTLVRLSDDPAELIAVLNDLVIEDPQEEIFVINYLLLQPLENQLRYISCGLGHLWHMPSGSEKVTRLASENLALGIDEQAQFLELRKPWNVGDRLVLNSFGLVSAKNKSWGNKRDKCFTKALKKSKLFPPQKQVERVLQLFMAEGDKYLDERPITLMSIQRKL